MTEPRIFHVSGGDGFSRRCPGAAPTNCKSSRAQERCSKADQSIWDQIVDREAKLLLDSVIPACKVGIRPLEKPDSPNCGESSDRHMASLYAESGRARVDTDLASELMDVWILALGRQTRVEAHAGASA